VYVTAPTHKAVDVLRGKISRRDAQLQTIHAFLGLKLDRDDRGGYALVRDPIKEVPERGVVFVDEASMVGADLWTHIEASSDGLLWVFVGDPAQLPPVNEAPSPIFSLPGHQLTEVVRQAEGNPIIGLATSIRTGHDTEVVTTFSEGVGVAATSSREQFIARAVHQFKNAEFQADSSHARVLCYRNRVVSSYNTEIRRRLYGAGAPRFVEREWIVASETYQAGGRPYLQNSEEVQVLAAEEDVFSVQGESWRIWSLEVKGRAESKLRTIPVLHEADLAKYLRALEKHRDVAKKEGWKKYYELRETFAQVEYLYAMTVHKSQGSTFHTVFADWRDLRRSGAERAALMYVAATRPSHRLAALV
jgi:exodeoxyribonuclease-5